MGLTATQDVKAYDSVMDAQRRSHQRAKQSLHRDARRHRRRRADLAPATIFDFSFAAAVAKELAEKR
jgi:hypothetical protein